MTTRHLVEISRDELERLTFEHDGVIELSRDFAYLRIGDTTYVAALTERVSR